MSMTANPPVPSFVFDRTGRVRHTSKGAEVAVHYKGPNVLADKQAFIAGLTFGESHADYEGSVLESVDELPVAESPDGLGVAELILNYKPVDSSSAGTLGRMNPGDWTLETDAGLITQPKEVAPPAYLEIDGNTQETWAALTISARDVILQGAQEWLEPQVVATRTDCVEGDTVSREITEAEAFETLGQLLSVASLTSWGIKDATQNRWLYNGKTIAVNGKNRIITRRAQCAATVWNGDVYIGGASAPAENGPQEPEEP